jgi:aminotransferase/cystathionine beta-lyase
MNRFDQFISRQNTNSVRWDKYAKDVIPLWVADMDFAVADCITQALEHRIKHPIYGYTHASEEFKEAIQDYLLKKYQYTIQKDWLVFIPSVVSGLHMAARNLLKPGEHALIPAPAYHHFQMALEGSKNAFSTYSYVLQNNRWVIDLDAIRKQILPNTRLLMLCNPHNPGGTVLSTSEIAQINAIAQEHQIIICSDEIHADLILDSEKQHIPIGKDIDPDHFTMSLMSLNKTFNFPGIGLGWAVIPNASLRNQFAKDLHTLIPGPNALAFEVSLAAIQGGDIWHTGLLEYLRQNRQIVKSWVDSHASLQMAHLDATYLAWIDATLVNNKQLSQDFVAAGVAISPGQQFGANDFFRLNFGTNQMLLREALARMSNVLEKN